MNWTSLDSWIVAAGVLCAGSCALLGNFLVLRRMSMMGDAISHAVLPGLAIAFLTTGSRGSVPMFVGAAVVGILTAVFTQWIHTLGKVEESASMGVVFTAMFAAGLILIVRAADAVDLDPGCVLYGAIELIPLDVRPVLGFMVPRAVLILGGMFAANLLFTLLFYKELRISAFDPALASTLGISARLMHYLLMTAVAITTVACFESVGSILVIAMLIVPASAAHLLTDRYGVMLILSVLIAVAGAILGHLAAITVPARFGFSDTSTSGMMAVTVGLLFALVMFLAPRHGVLSKLVHRWLLSLRIACEDVLGLLYRLEEADPVRQPAPVAGMLHSAVGWSPWMSRLALASLRRRRQVRRDPSGYRLTSHGRAVAAELVRAHRLWETYLAKHLPLAADHLHDSADRTEHFLSHPLREAIAADLPGVLRDPHGTNIPAGDAPRADLTSKSAVHGPDAEKG